MIWLLQQAKAVSAVGLCALALAVGRPAIASPAATAAAPYVVGMSEEDSARLWHGETVTREQTLGGSDATGSHYVGGITYTVVDLPPEELASILGDVRAYRQVLPRTKQARLVGENGPDFFVELRQGNSLMEAKYTLRARKDPAHQEVRFWLDKSRPHGIADAWGFFRYQAVPSPTGPARTLLTYGILVDVGPGLVRELFEERLRALMLSVPRLVQRYVSENARPPRHDLAMVAPN